MSDAPYQIATFRRRHRERTMLRLQTISVAIVCLVIVSPLVLLIVGSLKDDRFRILADMGSIAAFWVDTPSLNNFREVLEGGARASFARYILNSTIILGGTVILTVLMSSAMAFVLALGDIRGRATILTLFIALYIIPQETTALPMLMVVRNLGLMDGYLAQILPFVASPLFVFLFYQFFIQVPKEIVEAARMDGAGFFRIYASIFLPISTPAIAACAILAGIDSWNMYLWPLLVTQSDYARPVSVAVASYLQGDQVFWDQAFAASVLMMVPVIILYLCFQRWFVSSFMGSAVKG